VFIFLAHALKLSACWGWTRSKNTYIRFSRWFDW